MRPACTTGSALTTLAKTQDDATRVDQRDRPSPLGRDSSGTAWPCSRGAASTPARFRSRCCADWLLRSRDTRQPRTATVPHRYAERARGRESRRPFLFHGRVRLAPRPHAGSLVETRPAIPRTISGSGVPRSVATKLTGHKTDSICNRYAIVNERPVGRCREARCDQFGQRTGRKSGGCRERAGGRAI
jgi:hypothetical protein